MNNTYIKKDLSRNIYLMYVNQMQIYNLTMENEIFYNLQFIY